MLDDRWLKVFTVLHPLLGIAIFVEILRRMGFAFVAIRRHERAEPKATE